MEHELGRTQKWKRRKNLSQSPIPDALAGCSKDNDTHVQIDKGQAKIPDPERMDDRHTEIIDNNEENHLSNKQCEVKSSIDGMCDYCRWQSTNVIKKSLEGWIDNESISSLSVSRLLELLREHFPSLPKCGKSIRRRRENFFKQEWEGHGVYIHFPTWKDELEEFCSQMECPSCIDLVISIDGIPLANTNRKHNAYPILIKVKGTKTIFCCGIFCTNTVKKIVPTPEKYLRCFLPELKEIVTHGLNIGTMLVTVRPIFTCDAPVRQWLKKIISHTGYSSCERCVQRGTRNDNRTTLLKLKAPKRTDNSFRMKAHPYHHQGVEDSPLVDLPVDMISLFCLDYMHLVCLGVGKRLFKRLKSSKGYSVKCSLSSAQRAQIEDILLSWQGFFPSEFPRHFESGYKHMSLWKASEFRLMVLYSGDVLLSNSAIFSTAQFENFCHKTL